MKKGILEHIRISVKYSCKTFLIDYYNYLSFVQIPVVLYLKLLVQTPRIPRFKAWQPF